MVEDAAATRTRVRECRDARRTLDRPFRHPTLEEASQMALRALEGPP